MRKHVTIDRPFYVCLLILCSGFMQGCRPHHGCQEEAVFKQGQELFERYLERDAATARQCLEQEIALLENSSVFLCPLRRATVLFMECSRLYVWEKRLGNEKKADLALLRAKYWNLRRFEADGQMTADKIEEFRSFSAEKIEELVDASDKVHTKGKGPKYWQGD